jgi:hypothetical protein
MSRVVDRPKIDSLFFNFLGRVVLASCGLWGCGTCGDKVICKYQKLASKKAWQPKLVLVIPKFGDKN